MGPVLLLITDGARRWPAARAEHVVQQVRLAARAGISLVQVRERDLEARPLLDLVRRCMDAIAGTRARVLVNDRVDVALAAGAHGVHLRGDSLAAAHVRSVAPPGFLVGRSVHSVEEASALTEAGGLDYLLFGNVFETGSKPGKTGAGPGQLAEICRRTPLPVLALGGMTVDRAATVRAAGAAGLAAVTMFGEPSAELVARLRRAWIVLPP